MHSRDHKMIDNVKINTLRNGTNLPLFFDTTCSKSLKLLGQIRSSTMLAKLLFEGMLPGKKNSRRPKQRWRGNIIPMANN